MDPYQVASNLQSSLLPKGFLRGTRAFTGDSGSLRSKCRVLEYDCGDLTTLQANSFAESSRDTNVEQTPVSPFTQNLVIVNRQSIPLQVAQEISFINPEIHQSLVREFEYEKDSGIIHYDIKERDNVDDDGYARLITLNWWYQALSNCILNGALVVLDISSNLMFCVNILSHEQNMDVPLETAVLFVLFYLMSEMGAIMMAYRHVKKEWKVRRRMSPDLVMDKDLNALDLQHALHASAFFYFLSMDTLVRDIIIWLHPFKNVQPYCAMKCDGRRCYILGFASEYQFRVDSMVGQEVNMVIQSGIRLMILSFKLYIAIYSRDLVSAACCIPSFILVFLRFKNIFQLVSDRQHLWAWLNEQRERLRSKGEDERDERDDRLLKTLEKQKTQHFFGYEWGEPFQDWENFSKYLTAIAVVVGAFYFVLFSDMLLFHERQHLRGAAAKGCP